MMTNKTKRKIDNWIASPNFNEILYKWVESIIKMYSENYFGIENIIAFLNSINNGIGLKHEMWCFIMNFMLSRKKCDIDFRKKCDIHFRTNNTNSHYAADRIIEIYGKEFLYGLCVNGLKPILMKKKMEKIANDFN